MLIAEDEPVFRAAMADWVDAHSDFELVGRAENAKQAIEIAIKERPDIALVDVRMPAGGGPRATREICTRSPGTRVLALSAMEDTDAVFGMLRAGAIGYLLKGVSHEGLAQAITQAAAGQAILSPRAADVIKELVSLLDRAQHINEGLEALDRTKSELIQILAHELRTPVAIIKGTIATLAESWMNFSPEDIADLSASALRAAAKLARLATNVSTAAGLQDVKAGIPRKDVPLGEFLAKVSAEFSRQHESLVFPLDEIGPSASIYVNFDLAVRALVLVIENALEFSPGDQVVECGIRPGREVVEIHLSDRGPGIPTELANPHFRAICSGRFQHYAHPSRPRGRPLPSAQNHEGT